MFPKSCLNNKKVRIIPSPSSKTPKLFLLSLSDVRRNPNPFTFLFLVLIRPCLGLPRPAGYYIVSKRGDKTQWQSYYGFDGFPGTHKFGWRVSSSSVLEKFNRNSLF